ncbi:hypothetical protein Q7P37_011201 [Cladosporium fusiforme]
MDYDDDGNKLFVDQDAMNEAMREYEKLTRKDTLESNQISEPNSDTHPTCRICRSEGTPEEPLFHPCKCSGSIQYVHQECLMEWLSHSHKKHCELCKTPFRFTKLYDADMPAQLPWDVFMKRAMIHIGQGISNTARGLLVGVVWMVMLPWFIRWAWRWMFWLMDAGWVRDMYLFRIKRASGGNFKTFLEQNNAVSRAGAAVFGNGGMSPANGSVDSVSSLGINKTIFNATGLNQTDQSLQWPQADTSIFSSWTYLSELTPNPGLNRFLLDIFEGQLITCVVIIGFILIFLIREWVVQQQPLVNMDQLNNVQQQLREAADRVQEENDRFRRQQELLDQARGRLLELQRETEDAQRQTLESIGLERPEFIGWERLEETIETATEMLSSGDRSGFEERAPIVTEQIRAAGYEPGMDLDAFTDRVYAKLASYPDEERNEWEAVLVAEIQRKNSRTGLATREGAVERTHDLLDLDGDRDQAEQEEASQADERELAARPPMPEREFSSRATQIQRLLEEADGIFGQVHGDSTGATEEQAVEAGPSTVRTSSSESWQDVSQPREPSLADKLAELSERVSEPSEPNFDVEKEEIPITNAGPNAKNNIKRSGNKNARAIPEPKTEAAHENDGAEEQDSEKIEENATNENTQDSSAAESSTVAEQPTESTTHSPADPQPARANDESFVNRVGSAFREEFGLDEIEDRNGQPLADATANNDVQPQEAPPIQEGHETRPEEAPQRGVYANVADWFWGDIRVNNAPEPVPAAREQRVDDNGAADGARLPPPQNDHAEPLQPQEPANANGMDNGPDPEVVAAAAQAGLDAEAVEDAEDLEGIFELIGLQGPLTALFQTSMFCLVLVSGTVFSAVGLPYVFGKLVLSFTGSPVYFIFKLPLQLASFIADFVIDASLFIGGWSVMVLGLVSELLYKAIGVVLRLPSSSTLEKLTAASVNTATASGARLQSLFIADANGDMGINGLFLGWSVHSHASLRNLQEEIDMVLSFIGRAIFSFGNAVSSGSLTAVWGHLTKILSQVPAVPAKLLAGVHLISQYTTPLFEALASLKTGALTLQVPSTSPTSIDPTLVFWNTSDRVVTVFAGYVALSMLAALYVAADTPITSSVSGQRHEKMIRDTLRQAGGVLKVILIISIEMLVFPLYCGLLLDVAFLPLFGGASIASRLAFAASKPYTFCFMHWFVGTCYMFHFALFVGMCRKILRKGVLWFIRDPDDPTFHPVRDVLERNVTTQLRKIAFSALVYGALVILCLGGVIWTIGKVFKGIFPIQWITTEPVLEFPVDLLLYNFVTPLLVRLFKPSDAVNGLYAWWLRRCARGLRLSHFMFDDRRKDEEGHHIHKTWMSALFLRKADVDAYNAPSADRESTASSLAQSEVQFQRDGKYVLTPCNDQYRPPKAGEAFLHTDDEDVYIVDKDGKKNENFAKIYVPPLFRLRVTLFMVCLWMFSATTGLCATLVPLVFGRHAIDWAFPGVPVNDIYAYTLGAYTLSGVLYAALKSSEAVRHLREKAQDVDLRAWTARAASLTLRSLKCAYVYGFLGVALPTFSAFMLQFYIILPLHTYMVASAHEQAAKNATIVSTTNITAQTFNQTDPAPAPITVAPTEHWLTGHNIHVLQDFALGLLYCRIVTRAIATGPSSRAKEAFRRITAAGYLNPSTRLATRFIIIPALLLAALTFLFPPLTAWSIINTSRSAGFDLDKDTCTLLYRYSFPCFGGVALAVFGVLEVMRATERWRARVRDEVYLVGERLHNFGEKKPPVGSRSVVRKERVVPRREFDLHDDDW